MSGGLMPFNRTVRFASVASATYQTAPQPTSVPLMAGGASRQPPAHAARSAPTRRTDRPNQRAALRQAAQRFCRTWLLKLAFRGLRSTAALASTPTAANDASESSRRAATTTSEPLKDSAEALQAGASGVVAGSTCSTRRMEATSTGKRTVGDFDGASSPDRTRCRRGARGGGSGVTQSVPGNVSKGDPPTAEFVPSPPTAASPPTRWCT